MHKLFIIICSYLLLTLAMGCANTKTPKPTGFLPDYSKLKPLPSPENIQVYSYTNPNAKKNYYTSVIVESVVLYQTATKDGVSNEQIESARSAITAGIKQIVAKRFKITNTPGTHVAAMSVAITGATVEGESFKPWNIIPISAAIFLASKATNLDSKQPILVVEIKIVDSKTHDLLKETASTINGEKFRIGTTADKFQSLALEWISEALRYTSK